MRLFGKIVGNEIVDFGKGKDAVPIEELRVTIKLDPKFGGSYRGKVSFNVPLDESVNYPLGDIHQVEIERHQQRLDLVEGTR